MTSVLVADPPWKFRDSLPGKGRGAVKHYPCMPLDEIMRFPIPVMVTPSVLFLWRVSSMPQEALDVVKAWGFVPKSEIVWVKKTVHGKRHIGMGHIVRAEHETCLIATRGRGLKRAVKNMRSTFEAPTNVHSAKPDAFFEIVEELFPLANGPHVELFSRKDRDGWECLGNQNGSRR